MNFEVVAAPFHAPGETGTAQVTGLDTCIRKPLVVTCGLDKSVRVWNYRYCGVLWGNACRCMWEC